MKNTPSNKYASNCRLEFRICRPRLRRCQFQYLSQVEGSSARKLRDLLAATETIRDDEGFGRSFSYRRQKHPFSYGAGDLVFLALESKRTGHSAAARIERLQLGAHAAQQGLLIGESHQCLVVTM